MWRMVWPPLFLVEVRMVMVATWMSSGLTQWRCPPWQHLARRSRRTGHAVTHRRRSWRPRSELSACWWSLFSYSFCAGCHCTVSTPGGLSMTSLQNMPSQGHPLLLSICCATLLPASTRLFTASWTHVSAKPCLPLSLAVLHLAIIIVVAGYGTTRRMLWQRVHPCPSSVTLQSAPWEPADQMDARTIQKRQLLRQHGTPHPLSIGPFCAHTGTVMWSGKTGHKM